MAPVSDRMDRLYAAARVVARFWLWFFFRAIEVRRRERVPPAGPLLLCINHPNNLIDSLLVGAVLPRQVHYLATAALFRNPLMARFLRACGAIPVYRREDDPDKMDRNVEAFAACIEALNRGRLVAVYPEGTTHAEPRVQRIKTGAARIALAFEARRRSQGAVAGEGLALIPVGLSFEARKSFRGRVLISFGAPIPVAPYLDDYARDPAKAVAALTAAIQRGMEGQVVHVARIEMAELIRAVEELYRGDLVRELQEARGLSPKQIDPFRLSRAIADAVTHFREREPERVEQIWQRILGYRALLAEHRVRDQAIQASLAQPQTWRRVRGSWVALAGLPVFVYGATVNALPYFLPRWLSRRMTRRETDYATVRLLASIVAVPGFWGLEIWIVGRLAGPVWAAVFAASLPLSGLAAYRYLGGLGRLGGQLRFALLALTQHRAASRLLAERRAIIAELERAKADYLAATRGSSF